MDLDMGKVLIVDDEDIILEVGEKLFSFLGFECIKAKTSADAISYYKKSIEEKNTFKMVIIDILTNDKINTEELVKLLNEIDKNLYAVISSGYLNHPLMLNYKNYGFKASIKKPYGLKELQMLLENI
ncbi:MAG: response regulator [Spirochaetes bacterium]|nr:response regulator [Spirochaetota bacterium]